MIESGPIKDKEIVPSKEASAVSRLKKIKERLNLGEKCNYFDKKDLYHLGFDPNELLQQWVEANAEILAIARINTVNKVRAFYQRPIELYRRQDALEEMGVKIEKDALLGTDVIYYQGKKVFQGEIGMDKVKNFRDLGRKVVPEEAKNAFIERLKEIPKDVQEALKDYEEWRDQYGQYDNQTGQRLSDCLKNNLITEGQYKKIRQAITEGKNILFAGFEFPLEKPEPTGGFTRGMTLVWASAENVD